MQKWISFAAVIAVAGLAVVLSLPGFETLPILVPRADAGDAAAAAGPLDGSADAALEAATLAPAEVAAEADHVLDVPSAEEADASPAFVLPARAPKSVHCGVILVTFAGAQGAAANARSREDAIALADKLAAEARTNFKAAAGHGDSGSADDIGRIPRGVLEKNLEFALFTLPAGGVSDPVETPRGFWIAKRLE